MIAGVQKTSLIDYPQHVSFVVFTGGCNFRCPYCHNPELVEPASQPLSERDVLADIARRKKIIDSVCVTGGEPTLHKALKPFLEGVKALGLSVKLDTNGTNPAFLKELVDGELVDYVAMDIKAPLDAYTRATGVKTNANALRASIRFIIKSGISHEFRTTFVPGVVSKQDVPRILKEIKGAQQYCIQQFRPTKTLDPQFKHTTPFDAAALYDIQKTCASDIPIIVRA
ncbi:anaerobic ribonucleoside-triphosphate reductase activating protein [archaeon CG10_big_fil_rev_8_21_14_0_10_43_11]|nr:MAG: anaerobic ribonucleoside-triphosphate reductase activating protein [archaeon CG10_big_fil_rev_8_21_14_0_10_43_11]